MNPIQSGKKNARDKGGPFRLFLAGSAVSILGTRMSTIAFPMLALWLTGSPVAAGWTAFAAVAPSALVYMPCGALVDLWNPGRVMLISELGRGVAIGSVALALLAGRPSLSLLIGAAVIEEILEVFFMLAERRYVMTLADEQAASAIVQAEARTQIVVLAGRPLGGYLFGLAPAFPFVADTLSFVISVITLTAAGIRDRHSARRATSHRRPVSARSLGNDIRQGMHWLRRDQFARTTVVLSTGTTFICQALIVAFLGYAHSRQQSSLVTGIALGGSGLGGALGSIIASRLLTPTRSRWVLIRGCAWTVATIALFAAPEGFSFQDMTFAMFILGFTGAVGNVDLSTYLSENAPEQMLARVTGTGRTMSYSACAIGPVIGGIMVQGYGIRYTTLFLGGAAAALLLFSLLTAPADTRKNIAVLASRVVSWLYRRRLPVSLSMTGRGLASGDARVSLRLPTYTDRQIS